MSINRFLDASVGPSFLNVSNADLTRAFMSVVPNGEIVTSQPKGATGLFLSCKLQDATVDVPELGGLLTPQLWMHNANNGSQALTIGVGAFRFVCANGLFIGLPGMLQKIRHTDGPKANNFLEDFGDKIRIAAAMATDGTLIDAGLEALETTVYDAVDLIGSLPTIGMRIKDAAINAAILGKVRPQDDIRTAWGIYQLVNETARNNSRSIYRKNINDTNLLSDILALASHQKAA